MPVGSSVTSTTTMRGSPARVPASFSKCGAAKFVKLDPLASTTKMNRTPRLRPRRPKDKVVTGSRRGTDKFKDCPRRVQFPGVSGELDADGARRKVCYSSWRADAASTLE